MLNCRIINHCSSVVNYTWQQHATAEEDFDSAAADISDILKETSTRPLHTDQSDMLDSLLSGTLLHITMYFCASECQMCMHAASSAGPL